MKKPALEKLFSKTASQQLYAWLREKNKKMSYENLHFQLHLSILLWEHTKKAPPIKLFWKTIFSKNTAYKSYQWNCTKYDLLCLCPRASVPRTHYSGLHQHGGGHRASGRQPWRPVRGGHRASRRQPWRRWSRHDDRHSDIAKLGQCGRGATPSSLTECGDHGSGHSTPLSNWAAGQARWP